MSRSWDDPKFSLFENFVLYTLWPLYWLDSLLNKFNAWLNELHDVGPGFFQFWCYPKMKPGPPLFERGSTQEIEEPFRHSVSWVTRLPLTRLAFVFGRWSESVPEELALAQGTRMRVLHEINMDTIRSWEDINLNALDFTPTNFLEYDDE